MGNFAHNINFFGNISCEEFENNILNALAEKNYVLTDNAEESDYSVAYIGKEGLITLYENDAYSDFLAKELSKKIPFPMVVLDLLDSDCLSAVLMKNGRKHNTYISEPEMLEMRRTPSNSGNASRWKSVVSDIELLDKVFKNSDDAETKLFSISELLGLNSELAVLDYKYLDEFDLGKVKYLYFIDKNVPPTPEQPVFTKIMHQYMTNTVCTNPYVRNPIRVGNEFCATVTFVNCGKNTDNGFSVYSVSDCVAKKDIELTRLELINKVTLETKSYEFEYGELNTGVFGYRINDFHHTFKHQIYTYTNYRKLKNFYEMNIYGKVLKPCHVERFTLLIHPLENYYDGYIWIDLNYKPVDFTDTNKEN